MSVTNAQILAAIASLKIEMEARMTQADDAIAAVAAQITALQGQVTQLQTDLPAEIARLQATIASLQANGVTPQNLADLNTAATNLQNMVTGLASLDTQAKGA